MESQPSSSSSLRGSQPCRHYEFSEIQLATENFDESLVIGKGGFGKVFKGNVINGSSLVVAAIKRLDSMSTQGADEFWAEVETLSMLRHSNLVSLIGYCNHGKEMILVYEYMPNGTLDDHLHKLGTPLSWVQRLKICIGSGQGLHYLHTGTGIDSGVIHRDVKSSNILLHESWAAKISDFGLSRIGPTNQPSTYVNTLVKGTFGYLDPNYFATGKLTRKSDVYAFGVVLMEVLCRKRAVDRSLDWGLATWAQDSIKEGNLRNIIDSGITGEISPKCLKQFVGIAERCLHSHPKHRPTMNEVVVSLESILTLQEKINSSSQAAGKTIFGRMLMFPFTSVAEKSGVDLLSEELRQRVRRHKRYKWKLTRAVELDSFVRDLPLGLRRDIKRHLCLDSLMRVGIFQEMDEHLLDAMCDRLKPVLYSENSFWVREGDPVPEMLFITHGEVLSVTTDGGRTGFFNSINLEAGDFCGDELLTWALGPRSPRLPFSLPFSTTTVKAVTDVQAFALVADDLLFVASQFRLLHSRLLKHTFRYYSHQWRTWAAFYIQSAWCRHSKRKLEKILQEENRRMQDALATSMETSTLSIGASVYTARFSADALNIMRQKIIYYTKMSAAPTKPSQPDFDDDGDDATILTSR